MSQQDLIQTGPDIDKEGVGSAADWEQRAESLLKAGRFEEALEAASQACQIKAPTPHALYLLAVSQRYCGRVDEALTTLDALVASDASHARAHQERGHLLLSANNVPDAARAFHEAVGLNPALKASWKALIGIGKVTGNQALQRHAQREFEHLEALPKEVLSAASMMHEGKLFKAERLCRHFLQSNPQHVEAMRVLAALGVQHGILDDAEFLLESALEFEPDHLMARLDLVSVLYRRQKYERSFAEAARLREQAPQDLRTAMAYANQCVAVGKFESAIKLYEQLIARAPGDWTLHLTHGHALKTMGRVDDAVDAYRAAYVASPTFGDAYWSLANLKTYRFTADEVASMQRHARDSGTPLEDRIHLCFALGKHFDDTDCRDESFDFYQQGNRLRRDQLGYSIERTRERLNRQREVFTADFLKARQDVGCPDPSPIFIVGMPRAGSTLLEQILASHSQIDGTMELQNITAIAQRIDGRRKVGEPARYPYRLTEMSADELRALGEQYIEETRIHRSGARFFIDKLPNNFVHIGMIKLILPNAKIIDARRHPMGCCFSNFTQLFASGQEYTYGLREVGAYYSDYVSLMDHWDAVAPGAVMRVHYENVVDNLASEVWRVLQACGLPMEPACLEFHKTERSVRTPSSEQVRQPIYRSGMEHWTRFERHLDPLKHALGPMVDRYAQDLEPR